MLLAIFGAIIIAFTVHCDSNCPFGYSTNNNKICYKVVEEAIYGPNLRNYCERFNGFLVTIPSAEINQYLLHLTATFTNQTNFWIGLNCPNVDLAGELPTCVWYDKVPVNYTNYDNYSPLNGYPYTTFTRKSGQWNSNTGLGEYYPICQAQPDP